MLEHPEDETGTPDPDAPESISLVTEMRQSFLNYAMSVIVSRAIPDIRDGLKPVHRRILYAMQNGGYLPNRPYRKSARVVGDVIGRYHPHGDTAVYEALARMAQAFSLRLPLIDGQGNFGSIDGDLPAAMRYTEVRMARAALELLADIDRDTVDFKPNYDEQDSEPTVLPARLPQLLLNGSEGIAVGMATRIPPHNLGELIDAALALLHDPELSTDALMEHVPGPDFPTGGHIVGRAGIRAAYHHCRGSIKVRARSRIEEPPGGRAAIIVDEVPYQVNKARMVEEIAQLAKDKTIEGITAVRDESDRQGIRVVIELKRDATPERVLRHLHKRSRMQTWFGANMIALVGGKPQPFSLKEYLSAFLQFRETVIRRRTAHDLTGARDRAHVLCGLAIAVENLDEVVRLIRAAPDPEGARTALRERRWEIGRIDSYLRLIDDPEQPAAGIASADAEEGLIRLSDAQVRAILELRLQRLTGLGRGEIVDELRTLSQQIEEYLAILGNPEKLRGLIATELRAVQAEHATPRRTQLIRDEDEIEDEQLIEPEEMVVTVTHSGYIKRTPVADFRAQRRGGKGLAGMKTKDEDFITSLFVANTHTPVLFFTTDGRVFMRKVWQLPAGQRTGRGQPIVRALELEAVESGISISAMMPLEVDPEVEARLQIVFATSRGHVRRNRIADFTGIRPSGIIAMKLGPGEQLVAAAICTEDDDLLLASAGGRAVRFAATQVRIFSGRASRGVRGMRLAGNDSLVAMVVLPASGLDREATARFIAARRAGDAPGAGIDTERVLLFVDSVGAGKRVSSHEFPRKGRGGKGMIAMSLTRDRQTPRTVAGAFPVEEGDEVMLVTDRGQAIRCPVRDVSMRSRTAGGVWMLRTAAEEHIASVAHVAEPETGTTASEDEPVGAEAEISNPDPGEATGSTPGHTP